MTSRSPTIADVLTQLEPKSPCIRSCTLDADSDMCIGCYRMLEEITGWSSYSPEEKLAVLAKLEERKQQHRARLPLAWRKP